MKNKQSQEAAEFSTSRGPRHRYPGPPPFEDTPEDRLIFRGRVSESESITQLIIACRLVVLFGKSGLGKTSLLNAGVFPQLREQAFLPVPVRVQRGTRPVSLVLSALSNAAEQFATDHVLPESESLWELFKAVTLWHNETLLTPVLVFDQFEEIFTALERDERDALADELGVLVSGNIPEAVRSRQRALPQAQRPSDAAPHVKVILALREEYLASLQGLSLSIPQLFHNRFRLLPLADTDAAKAIREPAALNKVVPGDGGAVHFGTEPFQYEDAAVELMLQFLRGRSGQIEPWELQILCTHVERKIVPLLLQKRNREEPQRTPCPPQDGESQAAREMLGEGAIGAHSEPEPIWITPADLGEEDAMNRVLKNFYEDEISKHSGTQGRRARELCDSGLVNDQGHRVTLAREQIRAEWKVSDETLEQLVKARLLRREPRLESIFYEISHDTLAKTIFDHRPWRLPRRLRMPAVVAVVALGAIVALGIWYSSRLAGERDQANIARDQARFERNQANIAREKATRARDQSELLVAFLIGEDLLEKLRRSGQMMVLDDVQKQVEKYLQDVAGQGATRGSSTTGAFARLNDGDLALQRGKLDKARVAYEAAIKQFRELRRREPSDAVAGGGLAQTLGNAADVAIKKGNLGQARDFSMEALALRKQFASQRPKDSRLQGKLAAARLAVAAVLQKQGRLAEASQHVKQAFQVIQVVERRFPATLSSPEWDYLRMEAHYRRGMIAMQQRDYVVAEQAYWQQHETAEHLLRIAPFEAKAQYEHAVASYRLANLNPCATAQAASVPPSPQQASTPQEKEPQPTLAGEVASARPRAPGPAAACTRSPEEVKAEEYRKLYDTIENLTRWEPENRQWGRDLAAAGMLVAWGEKAQQHWVEAVPIYQRSLKAFEALAHTEPTNARLRADVMWAHRELADSLGSDRKALEHLKAALAIAADLARRDPSNRENAYEQAGLEVRLGVVLQREKRIGGALEAFDRAQSLLKKMTDIDPTDGDYFELLGECYSEQARALESSDAGAAARAARQAVEAAERALKASPRNPNFLATRSRALRGLGMRQEALPDFDGAAASYTAANESLIQAIMLGRQLDTAANQNVLFLLHYDRIAPLRKKQGDPQGALRAYREALAAIEMAVALAPGNAVYHSNLFWAHREIGNALRDGKVPDLVGAEGAYASAEQAIRKAIAIENTADHWNRLFLLHYDRIAPLRKKQGDPQGALGAYREALAAVERAVALAPGNAAYHFNLYLAHREIGKALEDGKTPDLVGAEGAYTSAEHAIRKAIAIENTADHWNRLFLLHYDSFAPLRKKQGDPQGALGAYREALAVVERAIALSPGDAVYHSNLHFAHRQIGDLLRDAKQRDLTGAFTEYQQALTAVERAAALMPGNAIYQGDMARVHLKVASVFVRQDDGALAEAGRAFLRGAEASRRTIELAPHSPIGWNLLALCHFEHGDALAGKNDAQAALTAYRAGIPAAEKAIALSPKEPLYHANLYEGYDRLAVLLDKQDSPEAADSYKRAISAIRGAIKLALDEAKYRSKLADSCFLTARFEERQLHFREALHWYVEALPVAREQAGRQPAVLDEQLRLVNVLLGIARTSENAGDVPPKAARDAVEPLAEAKSVLQRLNVEGKLSPEWQAVLTEIGGK